MHYTPYFRLVREDSVTGIGETRGKMEDKLAVTDRLLAYVEARRLPFEHPLTEFALRDFNYFLKIYQDNFDQLGSETFSSRFRELNKKFNFIRHGYGSPFTAT